MKTDERFPWWMFVALAVWLALMVWADIAFTRWIVK